MDNHELILAEKIKKATMNIMISNGLKIIGVVLYRFKIIITSNMPKGALAYVAWSKTKDDLVLIPHIHISSECHDLSVGQIIFILMHEIMHVLDNHGKRGIGKQADVFNIACDHIINKTILNEMQNNRLIEKPDNLVYLDELKDENLTAEEIYELLMKNASRVEINNVKQGDNGEMVVDANVDGKDVTITISPDKGGDGDSQEVKEQTDDLKRSIREYLDSDIFKKYNRGTTPGNLVEWLDKVTKVKIPWEVLLEKAIKSRTSIVSENRSWKSLNRRMRTRGVMIPSHPKDDSAQANMYVLVDNSGSISKQELMKFGDILINSVRFFNEVKVIKHDVIVQEAFTIDPMSNVEDIIKGVNRGGTSHTDCFQLIEDDFIEADSEDIGLVLILTDYESNIESIWNDYSWTKEVPVKVILTYDAEVSSTVDDSPIVLKDVD